MTLLPDGGPALPVSVTTTRTVQGGAAIPVYGYMTAPTDGRPAMGGSAIPVRVLTAADLKENGGMWTLEGRPHAMPVYTAPATTTVQGGPAIAVYPVNAWPTVAVVPVVPSFVPTDIAGLTLWLKADAGLFKDAAKAEPVTADADAVYTWADQSGNGRDAVQATAANRPLYKVNIQNGKPAVRFDGSNDILATAVIDPSVTAAHTYFVVAKRPSHNVGSFLCIFALSEGSGNNRNAEYSVRDWDQGVLFESGDQGADVRLLAATEAFHIGMGQRSGSVIGSTWGSGTDGGNYTSALTTQAPTVLNKPFYVGGAAAGVNLYNSDLCEVLVYGSFLLAAQLAQVYTYLNTRWAVY